MIILKSWINEWIDLSDISDNEISDGLEEGEVTIENIRDQISGWFNRKPHII